MSLGLQTEGVSVSGPGKVSSVRMSVPSQLNPICGLGTEIACKRERVVDRFLVNENEEEAFLATGNITVQAGRLGKCKQALGIHSSV